MNRFFFFVVLGVLVWPSCRSVRDIQGVPVSGMADDQLWMALDSARFQFETFSAKADLDIEDASGKSGAIAYVRMRRDSLIWISFRKAGIEGARLLITPDSVHILDRTEKAYYPLSYDYLRTQFNLDMPFGALQDMIVGNVLVREPLIWLQGLENDQYVLAGQNKNWQYQFRIRPGDLKMTGQSLVDSSRGLAMYMDQDGYESVAGRGFATERILKLLGEKPSTLQIHFSKMTVDPDDLSFSFNVSPSYSIIRELR